MSNELMEVDDVAIATSNTFDMPDPTSAKAYMDNYQELCLNLLDKTDYQKVIINGKERAFKKKSAWRKIATAFNLNDEIIEKEIIRDENQQIITATFYVKVTAPNGRIGMGTGSCSIFDKINKKDTEQPSNFELRKRFSSAENDVLTTAHTRAKSRAISDLVGMGEVSAEELGDMGVIDKPKKVTVTPKSKVSPKQKKSTKQKVTPKAEPKQEQPKTNKGIEEAIEVQVVESKPRKTIKDLMEESPDIKSAVKDLQDLHQTVNKDSIKDYLLKRVRVGNLTTEEYEKIKEIMD